MACGDEAAQVVRGQSASELFGNVLQPGLPVFLLVQDLRLVALVLSKIVHNLLLPGIKDRRGSCHRLPTALGRVKVFVPWEYQKWGALHCHPLLGGMPDSWCFPEVGMTWRDAQEGVGLRPGYAKVLPMPPAGSEYGKRVREYVAKYVAKDLHGDLWHLIGFPKESRPPAR